MRTHSDGDDGLVLKHGPDDVLNDGVGLHVDGGGCFIHDQDARVTQERTRQAEQLTLTHAEILTTLRHRGLCQGRRYIIHVLIKFVNCLHMIINFWRIEFIINRQLI